MIYRFMNKYDVYTIYIMNNEQTNENIFMQNAYYFMQKTYLNKIATSSSKLLTVILWLLQYEYIIV